MAKQYKNYVNGEWKTSENSITIYAPANGEELGSVPAMSQAEVDEVYAAAKAALPAWRSPGKPTIKSLTGDCTL